MEPPFTPYETGAENSSQHTRLRDIPFRMLLPNILTLLAICSGLTSIRFAIEGRIELALGAIILAAILDGIDGRVARFLKSSTPFGAQMDSLADFVNFGVAPAMVLYFTLLDELRPFGWVAALIYAMSACLRLARFNVQLDTPNKPPFQSDFFVGVPAPAGAMIALLPLYLVQLGFEENLLIDVLATVYIILVGLLMVSNIPTYSGKSLGKRIPRTIALPMILAVVVLVALLLSYPWAVLSIVAVAYLGALPWGISYYKKLEALHNQNVMVEEAEKTALAKPKPKRVRNKPVKKSNTSGDG
ncbi:MAG: CDP-diacylglycerol--serine O-phosphatidyltransferase [Salaquimonas sp.]